MYQWILRGLLFGLLSSSYAGSMQQTLDTLIDQKLPYAQVGMMVKDLQTGELLYARNPDKLMVLASGTKLFTAAAALYQLTPSYRFSTYLSHKAPNYYLTFSGSPSLTDTDLKALLHTLKTQGITQITGDIVLDVSRYQEPNYPAGTSMDDLGWYYSAPVMAMIINENAESFEFVTGDKVNMPVEIHPQQPYSALTLLNQVKTVTHEEEKDHCDLNVSLLAHNTYHIYGCMALSKEPVVMRLAIADPFMYAQQLILHDLSEAGIEFKGNIVLGRTPVDAVRIAHLQSDELSELVNHMLKWSDNVYANSLTKLLGYVMTGEGTYKQGVYAVKKILAQHTHVDMSQSVLSDGMGSRYDLLSPAQVLGLLDDLYHDNDMQALILNALPQAGVSGSLEGRLKGTPLEKNVFAKTGTMHDITSLSGYIVYPNAKVLGFSIIMNDVMAPISRAKALEEQLLLAVNAAQ